MTNKEAIRILEEQRNRFMDEYVDFGGVNEAYNKAIDLLKEQEAKPVIVTTNAYGTRFYHCPRCNRDLYVYPRQLYCSNCGQELNWE